MFVKYVAIITSLMLNIGNAANGIDGNAAAPTSGLNTPRSGDIIKEAIDARKLTFDALLRVADNINEARWAARDLNTKLAILRHIINTNKFMDAPVAKDDITNFIKQQLPKYVSFRELKGISEESELIARARQQDLRYLVFDHTEINLGNDDLIKAIQQANPDLTSIIDFGDTQSAEDDFGHRSQLSGRAIIQGDSLTTIGNWFLSFCDELTKVDLSGCTNLTSIKGEFLGFCKRLNEVDLSGCTRLTTIESGFILCCNELIEVYFPAFSNVTTIENNFLSGCNRLIRINLEAFSKVTNIGQTFLHSCFNLTRVDLSVCTSLSTVGMHCLGACNQLTDLALPSSLRSIGKHTFKQSNNLQRVFCSDAVKVILPDSLRSKCKPLEEWEAIVTSGHAQAGVG